MNDLNILVLSAGRRVELIQCFQEAAFKNDIQAKIIAADCSETAPALYLADKARRLPLISDSNYVNTIIDVCNEENVSLVVPTIDTDLLILAKYKSKIESMTNTKVLISDYDVVKICRDKILTHRFMMKNGIDVPKMYSLEEIKDRKDIYPLFIKPKSGSSSLNTFKLENYKDSERAINLIEEPIIQEFIQGEEFTVDVFLDFNSKIISVVPRLRIATRSGEISKGKIIKDKEIINNVINLMVLLKPIGHITVQLMRTENGIKYIEINPRFGGGAPMSIKSGANSCENLFKLLKGEELVYTEEYLDNITFLRFDSSVCINNDLEIV